MSRIGFFVGLLCLVPSITPSPCGADSRADSIALFGSWRWTRSAGGLMGANQTPPPSGWSRTLQFRRDGRYSYLENDSVGQYLLCSGNFKVHPYGERQATLWVELEGWWSGLEANQLVTFHGRDTMSTYPGSSTTWVSDAMTHSFVREGTEPPPGATTPSGERPARISNGLPGSYWVALPPGQHTLLLSLGQFFEWMDWQYPASIRKPYRYTHDQIPSAAIGDFDGDGSADVAVHGSTGYDESKVICLLSNHGERLPALLLSEPTVFESSGREPHPTLFLAVLHSGEEVRDQEGRVVSFPRDMILVARPDGYATPYYYAGGEFHSGPRLASPRWNVMDPG